MKGGSKTADLWTNGFALSMGYKKATTLANLFFIALAGAFLTGALHFPEPVVHMTVGPAYFPAAVAAALILASVVSTVKVWLGTDDHEVRISAPLKVLFVIGTSLAFAFLWQAAGCFYIVSFSMLALLLYGLNPERRSLKKLLKALALSGMMQIFVYIVFERFMYFRF